MSLLQGLRDEARGFHEAVQRAPDPRWNAPAPLRFTHKLVHTLLHEHDSPSALASAMFVGVLIGTTPLYGTHLLACLALGFLLRLNKLVMWIGSNVSFPAFAPFLGFACIQVAHRIWTGAWSPVTVDALGAHSAGQWFLYWLAGSPIVGAALGSVLAALTYLLAARRRSRSLRESP